ncbi:hypothetical protein [Paenibacillus sp.]|uniref:hypothetical protein n=1 Tax=Paenibacillus sp. TaxID=58172 RepID=UPI002D229D45|nr:hypothetical protein [Paenibacillus sp.]HZG84357.1 hypothetical protein [Paenibacillus sp.]
MRKKLKMFYLAVLALMILLTVLKDVFFPSVRILVFSGTGETDVQTVLAQVHERADVRIGTPDEAEAFRVRKQPTYLVLFYGFSDELTHREKEREWYVHRRFHSVDELVPFLNNHWTLAIWRYWLHKFD